MSLPAVQLLDPRQAQRTCHDHQAGLLSWGARRATPSAEQSQLLIQLNRIAEKLGKYMHADRINFLQFVILLKDVSIHVSHV